MAQRGRPRGGSKKSNSEILNAIGAKVDSNASKIGKFVPKEDDKNYKCTCCGKVYTSQKGNFPTTNSPLYAGNNGYLSICRACEEQYYAHLVEFYSGNEEKAIKHCCWLFDWYYNTEASAMTRAANTSSSRVALYPSKANMQQIKTKGKTYLDTLTDSYDTAIESKDELKAAESNGNIEERSVTQEIVNFWGYGYKPEEYAFLEREFADWQEQCNPQTKSDEECLKLLCVAQLTVQRASKSGNTKEISDASKMLQDVMGSMNLKPSQSKASNLGLEGNPFGCLVKIFEDEQPIGEVLPRWKDVDGIHKITEVYFAGHLANMLHVKNEKSQAYEKELDRWAVKPPDYTNVGEDVGKEDMSILDRCSDRTETSEQGEEAGGG